MYRLTIHAERQIDSKGLDPRAVLAAVEYPQTTYESRRHPGQQKRIRDGVCAVVDPRTQTVITVFAHRVETALRQDQRNDTDALAHERRTLAHA